MDIAGLMPLLFNLLGGGNTQKQQPQSTIPKDVLASYPTSILTENNNATSIQNQSTPTQNQNFNSQNLLLSLMQGFLGGNNLSGTEGLNTDAFKTLMPLINNLSKQKNSPPKFSELKSIDEYVFD